MVTIMQSDSITPLVLDAAALSAWRCTADDDTRSPLAHVCVRGGQAIAANGCVLAIADLPTNHHPDSAVAAPAELLVPRGLARRLASRLRNQSSRLPGIAWFSERGLTWLDHGSRMTTTRMDDALETRFPDALKILRDAHAKPGLSFQTGPELTLTAIKTIVDFLADDRAESAYINWRVNDTHNPLVLTAKRTDGRSISVVLMPMVIAHHDGGLGES